MSDSNDFLPIDNTLQTDSSSFTHRYIQDKNTNTSGKHLADLCMINNLKILNGRKIGELVGKYTYTTYFILRPLSNHTKHGYKEYKLKI